MSVRGFATQTTVICSLSGSVEDTIVDKEVEKKYVGVGW